MKTFTEINKYLLVLFLALCLDVCHAQTFQRPSAYFDKNETPSKTDVLSRAEIKNVEEFNELTRVNNKGTRNEIPHVLFLIDRKNNNQIYYINTPAFSFHVTFINYLLGTQYHQKDINSNYILPDRRFILGILSWQMQLQKYVYGYWEGDSITSEILKTTQDRLDSTFFAPVECKANSSEQEAVAKNLNIAYCTQEQLFKGQSYLALNPGKSQGRLRIISSLEATDSLNVDDILVLQEVPLSLPCVAGVITDKPSTLLSHINILTSGWGIPNIYLKDARTLLNPYDGKWVKLTASNNGYSIKVLAEKPKPKKYKAMRLTSQPDLTKKSLYLLSAIRAKSRNYCGSKAANLGEMKARLKHAFVPDGFSIPFAQYNDFAHQNHLLQRLIQLENTPDFLNNTQVRKKVLEQFRQDIISWNVAPETAAQWVNQWRSQLGSQGVFVRSSSNSEDLKNFSGAGLYTTIPNVKDSLSLILSVKKVWASLYNFDAFEIRHQYGIPDSIILMGVLVQEAINSETSGVMITKDPFNEVHPHTYYIAAKRGIGIKVVEGKRVAEQVMYSSWSKAVQVISLSDEDVELKLSTVGGVEEVKTEKATRIMSDEFVKRLADVGRQIKTIFKGTEQDIEWASKNGGEVIILQARPYMR